MRISIDATGLGGPKTGTAVYLSEILSIWNRDRTITHDFVVFASHKAMQHLSALDLDERFQFIKAPDNRYLRTLWQQSIMVWYVKKLNIDVHWGSAFVVPLLSTRPMVVTIHDLTFLLFPSVHEWIKRYYFPAMITAAVKKARFVLAVSNSTRQDLHKFMPMSRGKTVVTLLAARGLTSATPGTFTRNQANDRGGPYVIFVGTIEPRKNLERLIAAWRSIDPPDRGDTRLVIAGATGWLVESSLRQGASEDAIEFPGFVSDVDLARLMRGAMALVYPSLYEGFGLPVLEAMSLGIPILTSNVGATRELADGAALLVDPTSIESIREGLLQLLKDESLRGRLSRLGLERSASFSWKRTAAETLTAIERAAAG
jgi:glycosyltransferase involved in cell wall biosynthesis